MKYTLNQQERVAALSIDLLFLAGFCYIGFGSIFPPLGDKGTWFYAALLSSVVGSKLATPFYIKPVDAVLYALPAFVSLMLINGWDGWSFLLKLVYLILAGINLGIVVVAFIWTSPVLIDIS